MNERDGCALLRERFIAAGLAIQEGFAFAEGGLAITLDGFDPARRVGYEYLTNEAGDRAELTEEVVAELEDRMRRGELFLLLIDEAEVDGAATLARAADHFLGVLRARGVLGP